MNHLKEQKIDSLASRQAVVIGAGIGGLAAAIRMACKGYQVTVLEAADVAGGKLRTRNVGGYRFDTGPSLLTMPEEIDALFELAGKNPRDFIDYHSIETVCHYFWEDGIRFQAPSHPMKFSEEASEVFHVKKDDVYAYLVNARETLDTVGNIFLKKSLHELSTWFSMEAIKAFGKVKISEIRKDMNSLLESRFDSKHLVELFNRFATYNGSNPFRAPALLNMIAALEHGKGGFFPKGGMIVIPKSLQILAESLGVKFYFKHLVTNISTTGKKVNGVYVGETFFPAEIVVSNMDIWHTWPKLLPTFKPPFRILNQERSSSALVYYCGMKNTFPELGLHNIFFSKFQSKEFMQIFNFSKMPDDPTVYVHISSKTEASDAPPGGENWFILINAPNDKGQDWDAIAENYLEKILTKMSRLLGKDVSTCLDGYETWTPASIAADTLSFGGALYGSSSNSIFSAFFRHANENPRIRGLYHVGGTVHPGGGIPLCLLSAKIATDLIKSTD